MKANIDITRKFTIEFTLGEIKAIYHNIANPNDNNTIHDFLEALTGFLDEAKKIP